MNIREEDASERVMRYSGSLDIEIGQRRFDDQLVAVLKTACPMMNRIGKATS